MSLNSKSASEMVIQTGDRVLKSDQLNMRGFGPRALKWVLKYLVKGRLTVITPSGEHVVHAALESGPEAVLVLRNWRAIQNLVTRGDVGFAEAYIEGDWDSPDIVALLSLAVENGRYFQKAIKGLWVVRAFNRVRHVLRPNSKAGSKRNIAFHYDLGNEFYKLWLDPSMSYSSALYSSKGETLEAAQQAKLQRIVDLLDMKDVQNILEIGCGWGALAGRMAHEGANVTGVTLSKEQLTFAKSKIAEQNLQGQVDLRLQDYRDIEGQFDRIVSIEMLEAVGEQYWASYFETVRARLAPGGVAVLQVITIDDARYDTYRGGADFIQSYIFPGGMLPTKFILAQHAERVGLNLISSEIFGESYAETVAEWRHRFIAQWPAIERLGFNERFRRLWEYYLCYCEAGFKSGAIDVGLYALKG